VLDLVAGEGDELGWYRVAGAFGQSDHDQEGVGKHRQRGPAVPGAPAADLMLVQAAQSLGGLERLLDPPTGSGRFHQATRGRLAGAIAQVEGQLPAGQVAADKQPALPPDRRTRSAERGAAPGVPALALGTVPGTHKNLVVFGTVNANRRHYYRAAKVLADADRSWLEQLFTRRVPQMLSIRPWPGRQTTSRS
jgi:hypothetical protein